jgi:hypothetical protein
MSIQNYYESCIFYFPEIPRDSKRLFFSQRATQLSFSEPERTLHLLSQGDGLSFASGSFFCGGIYLLLSRHIRLHLTFSIPLYVSHVDSHSLIFFLTPLSPAGAFFFLVLMQVLRHWYLLSPSKTAHRESHSLKEADLSPPRSAVVVASGKQITATVIIRYNRYCFITIPLYHQVIMMEILMFAGNSFQKEYKFFRRYPGMYSAYYFRVPRFIFYNI